MSSCRASQPAGMTNMRCAQPLTGAIFDISVDIFQELLVERGLLPREIAETTRFVRCERNLISTIVQPVFDAVFAGEYEGLCAPRSPMRATMWATLWRRPGSGCKRTTFPMSTSPRRSSLSTR